MSLVIVGSVAFDTIETPYGRRERIVGGSCTYCALAARFFTQPSVVSVIGDDFPEEAIDFFRQKRLDLQGLRRKPGKTFHWEARYGHDPNERSTIKTELNVFESFRPVLPPEYRKADILFLGNIDPDQQEEVLAQVESPKLVAMDTINHWIESKRDAIFRILEKVDVFFGNEEEIRLLSRETNLIRAGKSLLERGPSFIAMKKGEHGAVVLGRDFVFGVLAHPCERVVDPTGAGDSFAGGFLGYLDKVGSYREKDMRRAAVFGSVMASFVIEDFGITRFKSLSFSEIEERYDQFKKLVSF